MFELLVDRFHRVHQWRERGATALPKQVRDDLLAQYVEILAKGFAVHYSQASPDGMPKKPGRKKQDASKNLLDALLVRAEEVLAFQDDLTLPFPNNVAERERRDESSVQQKIAGTFRRCDGATAFCISRSYLSTMQKQGRSMLAALAAVFQGTPFPVAWNPGF